MVTEQDLKKYQQAYSQGSPLISDEKYDELLEEYLQSNGEDKRPFNRQKQSSDVNDIVGTLPKVYGVTTPMRPNQKVYQDWVQAKGLTEHDGIILQPKFDGCSVALDFTTGRFFTRGDYDNGESVDVTDIFQKHLEVVKTFAKPGTTAMKFEAILSHEQFRDYQFHLRYKRPRDVVSATITSRNVEMAQYITLVPLRGYMDSKQYIPNVLLDVRLSGAINANEYSFIENFIKEKLADGATVQMFNQTFSIDGVVASVLTDDFGTECRPDRVQVIDPEREVAIKILYNVQTTKLKSVDYQFGKQGRITPVAILEPVKFDTVTVDHVTLSTLQRVVDMGLRHNDTVRVMYNIVPYLIDSEHDGDYPVPVPTDCPICGAKLDYQSLKQVRCSNPDCKGLKLGAIIRHAEKMKMVGLGKGVITKLYDEGILTTIEGLYHLRDWDEVIQGIDGFGNQSFWNMITSVEKALHAATLPRFLGALPFNDTEEKTWSQIINVMDPMMLINSMVDGTFPDVILSTGYIPGVGTVKIRKIIDGYLHHRDEIQSLMRWIPSQLKQLEKHKSTRGKVAMTGTRDAGLTKILEESGYEVGSFTNDCIALIVPDKSFTSAKTEKAEKLGIPIYDLKEAEAVLVNPF